MSQPKSRNPLNSYVKYSNLAFQILGLFLLGVLGGYKLDKNLSPAFPIFTLAGSLLAIALVLYLILKDFIKK